MDDHAIDDRMHRGNVARIADLAERRGIRVASAESMTGGLLAAEFAAAPHAPTWYLGGVVANANDVKRNVLCVRTGPLIAERAVMDMADGVALLLGATASVAVSGVLGPDRVEGNAPGTVWFGIRNEIETFAQVHHFRGTPDEICAKTCSTALALLVKGVLQSF